MKVVIIDYGMGNVKSILSTLKFLNVENALLSNKKSDILAADKIILPGVGSFAKAMRNIRSLSLDRYLIDASKEENTPILGICLGMQLMCRGSDEDGSTQGLDLIDATVQRFSGGNLKVPHVGFNQVAYSDHNRLYDGLSDRSDFYFTHSYRVESDVDINQSTCDYGSQFIASYEVGNIAGVQFHPELSQTNGLKLLSNFLRFF